MHWAVFVKIRTLIGSVKGRWIRKSMAVERRDSEKVVPVLGDSLTEDIVFLDVDVDDNELIADRWEVEAMPTFVFFRNQEKQDFHGQGTLRGRWLVRWKCPMQRLDHAVLLIVPEILARPGPLGRRI
ncbi:unnamed protein product [Prorocentrum cordatum]|uniref:Thioredoxin domain-containing protein n=1 Tax=Prorocentrum cordatum TaxID=2364126 RepID=A0ABN9U9C7_9DINO|nr:unnamed protein product [Polarella glacialis]